MLVVMMMLAVSVIRVIMIMVAISNRSQAERRSGGEDDEDCGVEMMKMVVVMMMRVAMISRYMKIRMSQVKRTVRKNSDADGPSNDGGDGNDEKRETKRGISCAKCGEFRPTKIAITL